MIAAEEDRIKERESAIKDQEGQDKKKGKKVQHKEPEKEKPKVNAP